ncbi:glycosyltransferase family 2 protein [Sulfurovum sp. NBC37-1]|uniref:glycosyltransferase family 2 protein n=1 Tax=Sulfurovum sp. (strain NBC37-1) TaxID=387093 RepID=UPI000158783F|nr:glycosyltransferase [Sulfurovum sp. NBC37-1]BAF71062.1 glycosyl transferase [Sulfurovum sp. NBC37-1]
MTEISIIIPCLNEGNYIAACIDSINRSGLESYELIFVDGGSSDATAEIIQRYQDIHIKLLYNPRKFTPISMNIGIKASTGKYIFIISAHAEYPKSYFSDLAAYIKKFNANCVGGVLITEVKNKNPKSIAIKKVLTDRLGVGNADFRTGVDKVKKVDTVAFGCYSRETFEEYGLYDERLVRNQDIEINKRIVHGGGSIYLVPSVRAVYYARETFTELARNQYQNGCWNILTIYYTKTFASLSLRHFVPLLFLLSLLLPLLFTVAYPKLAWFTFLSLVSYLTLVIIMSFRLKERWIDLPYLVGAFLTLHLFYGLGSLAGLFTVVKKIIKGKM